MRFHPTIAALLPLIVATSACNRDVEPTTPPRATSGIRGSRELLKGSNRSRPAEDRFVRIANQIQGFAGYFINGNRQVVAWIADTTNLGAAAAALSAEVTSDFAGLPARIRPHGLIVQRADYDFQTLSNYRDIVTDSLLGSVPGILFDDLDETINRVTIAILASQAQSVQSAVSAKLAQYGVPLAAIHFVSGGGNRMAVARHRNTPTSASSMLNITKLEGGNPDTLGAGLSYIMGVGDCTIGAVVDSGSTRMWLTASHCTRTLWQLDRDTASLENGTRIGVERSDPSATQSCTWIPFTCWWHRSSDAALIDFSFIGLAHQRRGVIARPPTRDSTPASQIGNHVSRDSLIDTSNPWLFIYSWQDASQVAAGEEIDKIGMRSGWSYGTVTHTCVDWNMEDGDHKVYCGFEADGLYTRQGDSGGPVFLYDGLDGAVLIGDVSGLYCSCATYNGPNNPLEGQGEYVSSISSAMADVGNLTVTSGITIGTPSISGSLSGGVPTISWSAVATNGTNTTQYFINRWVWDASTYTWMSQGRIATTTSTSYSDGSVPVTLYGYDGTSKPSGCIYTYVLYFVIAYNSGAAATSQTLYFHGDANGPDPNQIYCGDS